MRRRPGGIGAINRQRLAQVGWLNTAMYDGNSG